MTIKVGDVVFNAHNIFRVILEKRETGFEWCYPDIPFKTFMSENSNDEFFTLGDWKVIGHLERPKQCDECGLPFDICTARGLSSKGYDVNHEGLRREIQPIVDIFGSGILTKDVESFPIEAMEARV